MSTGRNFDEILRVVDSLQLTAKHKVSTPVNWKPGEDIIISGSVSDDEAKKTVPGRLAVAETVYPHRQAAGLNRAAAEDQRRLRQRRVVLRESGVVQVRLAKTVLVLALFAAALILPATSNADEAALTAPNCSGSSTPTSRIAHRSRGYQAPHCRWTAAPGTRSSPSSPATMGSPTRSRSAPIRCSRSAATPRNSPPR